MNKYIAILKSKTISERAVIKKCFDIFDNGIIVPYIEFIRPLDDKVSLSFLTFLAQKAGFAQIYRGKMGLTDYLKANDDLILKTPKSTTIGLEIYCKALNSEMCTMISDYIDSLHSQSRSVALRFRKVIDISYLYVLISKLNADDYMIIDTQDSDIDAYLFNLMDLSEIKIPHKVIFSSEIPSEHINKDFALYGGNNPLTNLSGFSSVYIKNENPDFWYGSYCGARDRNNEDTHGYSSFGVFFILDLPNETFFSIRSPEAGFGSSAYHSVIDSVKNHYEEICKLYFSNSPISKDILDTLIKSGKSGNASSYIKISMINYLEQVNNLLTKKNPTVVLNC
jgi:hypothetical protein